MFYVCVERFDAVSEKFLGRQLNNALFSSTQKPIFFQDFLSHQILRHIHGALNIDKNKKLIAQFVCKS